MCKMCDVCKHQSKCPSVFRQGIHSALMTLSLAYTQHKQTHKRREEIVRALPSNTVEQLEANVASIVTWIREQASRS